MSAENVEPTNEVKELSGGNNSLELPGASNNEEAYTAFGGEGENEEEMEAGNEEFVGGRKRRQRRSRRSRKNNKSQKRKQNSRKNNKSQKKRQNSRKNNKSQKRGGKKTGVIETAAVPFGLLALQHYASKKVGKKSRKSRKGSRKY
jgi:hypothetical protein